MAEDFKIPCKYSLLSAQSSPTHNEDAHKAMLGELERDLGLKVHEIQGQYDYPERAFLVEHPGTPEIHEKLEHLGRKYGQQSVLHSADGKHTLVDLYQGTKFQGEGYENAPTKRYLILPDGKKIRVKINEAEDVKPGEPVMKSHSKLDDSGSPRFNEYGYKMIETDKADTTPGKYVVGISGSHSPQLFGNANYAYYVEHPHQGKMYSVNLQNAKVFRTAKEANGAVASLANEMGFPHENHRVFRLGAQEDDRNGLKIAKTDEPVMKSDEPEAPPAKKRIGGNLPTDEKWDFMSHHNVDDVHPFGAGKAETCAHCDKSIRNVVTVTHPEHGQHCVGEDCAEALIAGEGKTRLKSVMDSEKRKQRLVNDLTNKIWKSHEKGGQVMVDYYKDAIARKKKDLEQYPNSWGAKADIEKYTQNMGYHQKIASFQNKIKEHFGEGPEADKHAKKALKHAIRLKVNQGVSSEDHDPTEPYRSHERKIMHSALDRVDASIAHVKGSFKKTDKQLLIEKLVELKSRTKGLKKNRAVLIKSTELINAPEVKQDACSDCGDAKIPCACFGNLPRPTILFNQLKKSFSVQFSEEWEPDQRSQYLDELKKRTLATIRKNLKNG